jgi:predicted amidohydrolase YtcJ
VVDQTADIIYRDGTVLTMVDERREAEAVAIAAGRIVAVGSADEVLATRGDATTVVDLMGRTLMPSFIDPHGHFMNAVQVVKWANVQGVPAGPITRVADFVPVLQEHVRKLDLRPGDWIIGYGYDRSNLVEQRELTVDDLDPAFPDNPVMLIHSSNHGAILSSNALKKVGYDENTETPAGGVIVRKPGTNVPAGLIMETAFLPIFADMPQPTERELLDTLDAAQQIYARVGVTTCQEGATHAKDLRFLRKGAAEGLLYLDVVSLPFILEIPALVKEYAPDFSGAPMELPDQSATAFGTYRDHLKLQGIKFLLDGSPQGKTAFWTEPLLTGGPAGERNWRGRPVLPPEVINQALAEAYAKGIQVFCHANGDAAIDMAIDGLRAAGARAADDRRSVVIHSQCMRPDQLDAYVELGITPSFFTAHTFYWGEEHLANLGPDRAGFISPMASAFAKGLHCSNHTDFSVTPMEPMRVMWSSITRTSKKGTVIGPDERIDIWQALRSQTIEAAWQLFEENLKGTLEPGKLADLVILDANPLAVEPDALLDVSVIETLKEGKTVYRVAGQ